MVLRSWRFLLKRVTLLRWPDGSNSRRTPCTFPIAVYEAVVGVARRLNVTIRTAETSLDRFLMSARVRVVPITAEMGRAALSAFERFGTGRHPAALNMGDCFACACARQLDLPLLF